MRQITFIASLPKAGTYLFAKFLENLGLRNTRWHVGFDKTMLGDVADGKLLDFALPYDLLDGTERKVDIDRNVILKLLDPDQFCVGHLPPHVFDPTVMRRIKTIFLYRDFREILQSTFHYFNTMAPEERLFARIAHEPDIARRFERYLELIMPHTVVLWHDMFLWLQHRNAFPLSHAAFGKRDYDVSELQRAAAFLGVQASPEQIQDAMRSARLASTITKNVVDHSERADVWTPYCENIFVEFGVDRFARHISEEISALAPSVSMSDKII